MAAPCNSRLVAQPSSSPPLSVIIPALNEAQALSAGSEQLRWLRGCGHEVIIVDGGSSDDTPKIARRLADRLLLSERGRARQMNAGARAARGEVLLFLHADTRLPENAPAAIGRALQGPDAVWGRFDVRLSGGHWLLGPIAAAMNLRSRITGIATGDHGLFVRKAVFDRVGGFPDIALMEDIAFSRTLKRVAHPICLGHRVTTSGRRWRREGVLRTVLLMWRLRLAYALGVDPGRLERIYYRR